MALLPIITAPDPRLKKVAAAVDTVEKLAPFAPFPRALARETQQLDIIRTWQFRR